MSLEEYVRALFISGKTKSHEFQTILRVFGREKIELFYNNWKEGKPLPEPISFKKDESVPTIKEKDAKKLAQQKYGTSFADKSHPEYIK